MDKVLILDFGSQYTQLIARRIREMHVYCEIHPFDIADEIILDFNQKPLFYLAGRILYTQLTPPKHQKLFLL